MVVGSSPVVVTLIPMLNYLICGELGWWGEGKREISKETPVGAERRMGNTF